MILGCRFGEHLDSLMFLPSIVDEDEDEDEDDDGLSMKSVEGLGKRQISWIQKIFFVCGRRIPVDESATWW